MKTNWIKIVGSLSLGALALTGCKKSDKEGDAGGKTEAAEKHCAGEHKHAEGAEKCGGGEKKCSGGK